MSFLSLYVLSYQDPKHSPIHDLESIVWVLLWVIGQKAVEAVKGVTRERSKVNRIQEELLDCMDPSYAFSKAATLKSQFIFSFLDRLEMNKLPWLEPFSSLLISLALLVQEHYKKSVKNHDDPFEWSTQDEIETTFERYLDVFEGNMPQEESWEYLRDL